MLNTRLNDKYRRFTDLPTEFENNLKENENESHKDLFDLISKSEIGANQRFVGPFGSRQSNIF